MRKLFVIIAIIIGHSCIAQEKGVASFKVVPTLPAQNYSLKNPFAHSFLITPSPIRYTHEIPKGAIFCRMEDALHKRFGFWLKFRMGTDDRYSD